MFGLGIPELVIVLLILVVLFGGTRIAKLGEGLGKAIAGFRRGVGEDPESLEKRGP